MSKLHKWQNENGTWNGTKMFSDLTGLSEDEIKHHWEEAKKRKKLRDLKIK